MRTTTKRARAATSFLAALLAAASSSGRADGDPRFTERALAAVPRDVEVDGGIAFAADGSRVAYVGKKGGKLVPVVDATVFDAAWWVHGPEFGADGRAAFRLVKAADRRAQATWVLLDGKKLADSDGVHSLEWSPDGRRLAYAAYPECRIAEDGSRTGDCVLVVDGKKGTKWKAVSAPVWSRDSKHVLAVVETRKVTQSVVLDDRPIAEGRRFDGPVFSPDGGRVAYAMEQGAAAADPAKIKWVVACGDLRLGADFDRAASPVFSPDGRQVAFKAEKAGRVGISVDGAAVMGDWVFVAKPVFSPDGAHTAYAASNDCTVVPGTAVIEMGDAFVKDGTWQLVVDGKASAEKFDSVKDISYSADGKHIAFRGRSGRKWRIVCGAQKSAEFDVVGPPQFSPDSTRLAFGVLSGRDFAWKILAVE